MGRRESGPSIGLEGLGIRQISAMCHSEGGCRMSANHPLTFHKSLPAKTAAPAPPQQRRSFLYGQSFAGRNTTKCVLKLTLGKLNGSVGRLKAGGANLAE